MYQLNVSFQIPGDALSKTTNDETILHLETQIEELLATNLMQVFDKLVIHNVDITMSDSELHSDFSVEAKIDAITEEKITKEEIDNSVEETVSKILKEMFHYEPEISVSAEIVIQPSFTIRINQKPLAAQNFATVISNLTELYTKCWLIVQNEVANLIQYTQTHDMRFSKEAHLTIARIIYNSPVEVKLETGLGPKDIGEGLKLCVEAMQTGIDAIAKLPGRVKAANLENQAKELDLKSREQEMTANLAEKDQTQQLSLQKAEQEHQLFLLEKEMKRLELLSMRLDIDKKRFEYAIEIAERMVHTMNPDADPNMRAVLIQTLLPNVLQLGMSDGLELAIRVPKTEEKD